MTQTVVQHLQQQCRPQPLPRTRKDARRKARPQLAEGCFNPFSDATQQGLLLLIRFGSGEKEHAIFFQQLILQSGTPITTISQTSAATLDGLHQCGGTLAVIPIAGRQNGIDNQPGGCDQQMQFEASIPTLARFPKVSSRLCGARPHGNDESAETQERVAHPVSKTWSLGHSFALPLRPSHPKEDLDYMRRQVREWRASKDKIYALYEQSYEALVERAKVDQQTPVKNDADKEARDDRAKEFYDEAYGYLKKVVPLVDQPVLPLKTLHDACR